MLETYSGEVALPNAAPPREQVDDIRIFSDHPVARQRRRPQLLWLIALVPWLWFLVEDFHSSLELIAILLPILTVGAAVLSLLLAAYFRSLPFFGLVISLTVFYVVAILLPGQPLDATTPTETSRIASINLAQQFFTDNELGFFVFDREPDIFFGVELRETHDDELRTRYEYFATDVTGLDPDPPFVGPASLESSYRGADAPSIGLYSNFVIERLDDPMSNEVEGGLPGIRARVQTDHGPLIVYALHIPRPGTGDGVYEVGLGLQDEIVQAITRSIEAEEDPVVVVGDFNIVDRGPAFADLTSSLTDAMRTNRWAGPTRGRDFWHTLLQLRIDHILVSEGLCVADAQAPEVLFSDHTPVQADFGPCPSS